MPRYSVALVLNFVPPYRLALFRALAKEVQQLNLLVATDMEPDRPWQANHSGLDLQKMRTFTRVHHRLHPNGFKEQLISHFAWDLIPRLGKIAPTVVISGEFGLSTLQACLYRHLAPLFGNPTKLLIWATVSEQTERGRGWIRAGLRRLVARMADGVLTNGASGARYLEEIGFRPNRIFQVHQSTDLKRFENIVRNGGSDKGSSDSGANPLRLVSVGSLIPRKGLTGFLTRLTHWCEAHPKQKIIWRLIGDGPDRIALETASLPANLTLEMLGNQSYEAVPALMTDCDLFVFPTLADEWGLVVNEAMAACLPVLASQNSQAAMEMVIEGENGWLFDPGEPISTDRALMKALTCHTKERHRLGANARQRAGEFSHANTLRRILNAIDWVEAR